MRLFFIGICGVSMSALAYMSKLNGEEVIGSDLNYLHKPKCLNEIDVFNQPYIEGVKWADIVICSSAIKQNDELDLAKSLGKKVISRGEYLGKISKNYEKVIAVAGSHGKTTTTAMIYHILKINGFNPSLHLGGILKGVGNVVAGNKKFFVTEACEYCDNFLFLHPYLSVVTNIEPEHLDYFKTFEREVKSFNRFKEQSEVVVEDFGPYSAKYIRVNKFGEVSFSLFKNGVKIDRIYLKIGGAYNVKNALYALYSCEKLGVKFCNIKIGLRTFKGVKKRCERVDSVYPFRTFIDYAHHPREILESVKYFKKICKGKCVAIFQPHTYSRTKKFFDDFLKSLSIFDEVIFFKTYPAREKEEDGLNETDLFRAYVKNDRKGYVCYGESDLKKLLKKYANEDLVVFLGAGDLPDKFDFNLV